MHVLPPPVARRRTFAIIAHPDAGKTTLTKKLFEVCRLRDVPIATFINKLDRDGRDPFELLDEIAHTLALDVSPASWPIGMGKDFRGCYDLRKDQLILMERSRGEIALEG